MAWTDSRIFRAFVTNPMLQGASGLPTAYGSLTADAIKAALFNNSITPDRDVAVATSGYNSAASQWLVANEVTSANWAAGGRTLANDALTQPASGVNMYDADDLAGGGTVTLAATHGCLVYDDTITAGTTVADQGVCFNYFGGAQQVTAGTFTIVWNSSGIFRFTV